MVELFGRLIGLAFFLAGCEEYRTQGAASFMPTDKTINSFRPHLAESELDPAEDEHIPSGRIIHDHRGNAVWKWYGDDDTSSMGTGTGVLEHLDADDLKVEGQNPLNAPELGGGYDPYNQVQPKKKR
jgi:hypothetical protein